PPFRRAGRLPGARAAAAGARPPRSGARPARGGLGARRAGDAASADRRRDAAVQRPADTVALCGPELHGVLSGDEAALSRLRAGGFLRAPARPAAHPQRMAEMDPAPRLPRSRAGVHTLARRQGWVRRPARYLASRSAQSMGPRAGILLPAARNRRL